MPALTLPELYLCADGGGTSVTVAIASSTGVLARGSAGACNVKTVGHQAAINAILKATYQALSTLTFLSTDFQFDSSSSTTPPPLPRRLFKKVWLGLAGICYETDIQAFDPFARLAFRLPPGDDDILRITSDGNLLAAPCTLLDVDSALALVAGTGTIGLAFHKAAGDRMDLVGVSGGWGYLLGDEGSAFGVARLAIQSILHDDDARQTAALLNPLSRKCPAPLLPFYRDLLKHFGVSTCAALVDKTYSDHSSSNGATSNFHAAEANRKIWIAEATRLVFKYAFGDDVDDASRVVARGIAAEGVKSLVDMAVRLVGDSSLVEPSRAALSLGGGLWKVRGYITLLEEGLRERGLAFASLVVVGDPAEEGVRALVAQSKHANVNGHGAGVDLNTQ